MTKPVPVVALVLAACTLLGCISTARKSIPREESHYARSVPHQLERAVAFQRVERALTESYEDLPQVLRAKKPDGGTFLLEPIVTYRKGGPMGEVQHARYSLEIVVHDSNVGLVFELGPDVAGGGWAPAAEIPYIHRSFDQVVENVEKTLTQK